MAWMVNICPACDDIIYECLELNEDEESMSCSNCGHTEHACWWEMQNIELFITVQGVHNLVKAGELRGERIDAKDKRLSR